MKKTFCVALAFLISLVFLGSSAYAEWAKEGSGKYRSAKQFTFDVLAMGKERRQINMNQLGMVVDAPENSPFQDATFKVIGTVHVIGDEYTGSGFVEYVATNGDKIYGTYTTKGIIGKKQDTLLTIVGGTGECTGIQGKMKLDYGPKVKPAKKGVGQDYSLGTVSWKIP